MSVIYWTSDGAGSGVGAIPALLHGWIVAQGDAALIINGGDVYNTGTDADFAAFAQEMGNNLRLICETPGNHDWKTHTQSPQTGDIPSGYEKFWTDRAPPLSKQPIDTTKKGGARYEHFIDLDGWRLIFLNTATSAGSEGVWPAGDAERTAWLRQAVQGKPGRAKIVFAHHSRLNCGSHPDNPQLDTIWRELFDANGAPLATCTIAGHNHNVSLYGPRSRNNPEAGSVPFAQGIYMMVNGASGVGFYPHDVGTMPDLLFNHVACCVTRVTLENAQKAQFDILSFGHKPKAHTVPKVLKGFTVQL